MSKLPSPSREKYGMPSHELHFMQSLLVLDLWIKSKSLVSCFTSCLLICTQHYQELDNLSYYLYSVDTRHPSFICAWSYFWIFILIMLCFSSSLYLSEWGCSKSKPNQIYSNDSDKYFSICDNFAFVFGIPFGWSCNSYCSYFAFALLLIR